MKFSDLTLAGLIAFAPVAAFCAGGSNGHHHDVVVPVVVAPHGGLVEAAGTRRLELTHDPKNGRITVYVLANDGVASAPIPGRPLKIRVDLADPVGFDDTLDLELLPVARESDPAGFASRFVTTDEALRGLIRYNASVTTVLDGESHEVGFVVDADSATAVFVCPMGCDGGRNFSSPGSCPVCGMALKHPTDAHGDHNPRHNGIVFMAANGYHHLEGVLPTRDEFRLYFYNDFTQPIPVGRFADGSSVEIVPLEGSTPAGEPVLLALASAGDEYLTVSIPEGLSPPLGITVRLQFEGRDEPDLFNFDFDKLPDQDRE